MLLSLEKSCLELKIGKGNEEILLDISPTELAVVIEDCGQVERMLVVLQLTNMKNNGEIKKVKIGDTIQIAGIKLELCIQDKFCCNGCYFEKFGCGGFYCYKREDKKRVIWKEVE